MIKDMQGLSERIVATVATVFIAVLVAVPAAAQGDQNPVGGREFCIIDDVSSVNVRNRPSRWAGRVGRLAGGTCGLRHMGLELASEEVDGKRVVVRAGIERYRGQWVLLGTDRLQGWIHARYIRERSSALAYDLTPATKANAATAGFGLAMILALVVAGLATVMRRDELGSCLAIQLATLVLTLVVLGTAVRTTTYCVVGVSDRQTFAIREYAGHFERRIGRVRANTCGIVSRQIETKDGRWRLIEVAGTTGWADASFLQPEVSMSPGRWFSRTTILEIIVSIIAVAALAVIAGGSRPAQFGGSSLLRMVGFSAALVLVAVSLAQAGAFERVPVGTPFAYVPAAIALLVLLTLLGSLPVVRRNRFARYAAWTAQAVGVPAVFLALIM